ncbi:MotA/TolQ/ExbB proton channel family protein [Aquariibacter albus]|uniref:MotA/TolQ/ExbB proton channel family protein n=1 Tax=Aquariibacter albus TaxID=2759899 RepID=A0A839HU66_9BURK|nr:MotA/TolQ/ExbB proton channel family protein [Aquariibacter albus]MBB1161604.1 MotA/TolQ/ExbB proton channel family protein [Aquariibacter albus]
MMRSLTALGRKLFTPGLTAAGVAAGLPPRAQRLLPRGGDTPLERRLNRLAWGWWVLAGVLVFVGWWVNHRGLIAELHRGDPSGISLGILVLAIIVSAWAGLRMHRLAAEARPDSPWRLAYRQDVAEQVAETSQRLAERTHGPHETAWWFASAAIKLGLLGTVVGFIIMATQIANSKVFELAEIQALLQQMTAGMAIALYTTLVGLIANLWMGFLLLVLDRSADRLAADILSESSQGR